MTGNDRLKALELATCFRSAIESIGRGLSPAFEQFPRGACGEVAPLLGTYFIENGLLGFEYILGERGSREQDAEIRWHSHAWIQRGSLIVDITADQFVEIGEPVIVTDDSHWHQTFEQKSCGPADFRKYDARTVQRLIRPYAILRSRADAA